MQKFRVLVIELALRNNKIAKSGDLVSESQLTGKPADLVKSKHIEPVGKNDKSAEQKAKEEQAKKEAEEKYNQAYEAGKLNADQLDSISMDEIYKYAEKHSLDFDKNSKKSELIEQVLKGKKLE